MKKLYILLVVFCFVQKAQSQVKILFDATKGEAAGNADWIIDASLYNMGFFNSPGVPGTGTEANPARIPLPAQSGINASTPETFWQGGISYWGVDCVNRGYTVETLPYGVPITYGNTSNPQDLRNYKVFIVCEPNILFTAAEKTAIMNFVRNGGGLFMVADHDVSDRNGDGDDSPHIWNDLMANNTVAPNAFGMTFDYVDISQTSNNVANLPSDSLLHGPMGNVTQVKWSGGTTMTLSPSQNPTVEGVFYKTNSSTTGNNNVFCAWSRYGRGKVVGLADSSPCDDGTGDNNDVLYDGYITDANGNHRKLIMNATIWLATGTMTDVGTIENIKSSFELFPNPIGNENLQMRLNVEEPMELTMKISDMQGRTLLMQQWGIQYSGEVVKEVAVSDLPTGMYCCSIMSGNACITKRFVKQ